MVLVVLLSVGVGSWAIGWGLDKAGDALDGDRSLRQFVGLALKVLGLVISTVGIAVALEAAQHPYGQ
jgi:hypothetical protein